MKFFIFSLIAKSISLTIKLVGRGSGNVWPGHVVLKLWPAFFKYVPTLFPNGVIVVSGTNGKTTTSKLLTHMFGTCGYNVVCNSTGANLLNGIASSILLQASNVFDSKSQLGIFEVDELTLPKLLKHFDPDVVVLLNLSRDQLDRSGEIDIIFERWLNVLKDKGSKTSLVLDSEQTVFNSLAQVFDGKVFYFDSDHHYLDNTRLHGSFNAKNVNAAVTCAKIFGLKESDFLSSLGSFEAAYGRGEILEHKKLYIHVYLAKNPASVNNNLDMLCDSSSGVNPDTLLFVLNDEVRDGRDVSWIYDIHPIQLKNACANRNIFVSGNRCFDMAARLVYAGVELNPDFVNPNIGSIVELMSETFNVFEVVAMPNYSSMLALRKFVTGKEIL